MKKTIIFFIFLLLTGCLGGNIYQATYLVEGIVYHVDSQIPLADAEVSLVVGNHKTTLQTKYDGKFAFKVTTQFKNGIITVKRKGYHSEKTRVKLDSAIPEIIFLSPRSTESSLVSGWVDFALPPTSVTPMSTPNLNLEISNIIPIEEPTELIVYPVSYSDTLVQELCQTFGATGSRNIRALDMIILQFPQAADLNMLTAEISQHPQVLDAFINELVYPQNITLIPNDPNFDNQWNFKAIYLPKAWNTVTGEDSLIRIAVIDSEILPHEDLKFIKKSQENDYLAINKKLTAAASNNPTTPNSHGTHVAGIIGATTNNQLGIAGTMWDVELISIPALNGNKGTLADLIWAVEQAIELDVDIINLSLGIDYGNQKLHDAIIKANQQGIILVAAAGNEPALTKYPAQYPEVIAVGATNINHEIAYYSAYQDIKIFAPGGDNQAAILSTDAEPDNQAQYRYAAGTSMACPHVTGLIGLILSNEQRNFTNEELIERIWQTGTTMDFSFPEQRLINAYAAVHNSNPADVKLEFMGTKRENQFIIDDIDQLRYFSILLPADQYQVRAHLDVNGNNEIDKYDWYYEDTLQVFENKPLPDLIIRMEIVEQK